MSELSSDEEPPPFVNIDNTLFLHARNLERAIGFGKLYIKFEGNNPTGTQKDRIAVYHITQALQNNYDGITVGTCGNYGLSISYFAKLAGLRFVIFVPKNYCITPNRKNELLLSGTRIITIDGKYEEAVEASKKFAFENHFYDANPGKGITDWIGYMKISYEIFKQLGRVPTAVAVPVGNGTTLTGIYFGFRQLLESGKTDKMPCLIGASTYGGNPVVESFKDAASKVIDLLPSSLKETAVNEPLISYHSYDGNEALHAIYDTNGWADYVSDSRMLSLHTILKDTEGLSALPASASAIEGLIKFKKHRISHSDYVIVLTGRKFR